MSNNKHLKILGDLEMKKGAIVHDTTFSSFPKDAKLGTDVTIDGIPYRYVKLNGISEPQWLPLGAKQNSYSATIPVASKLWEITHKLGSEFIMAVTYDENGKVVHGETTIISADRVEIQFELPQSGKIVVLSSEDTFSGVRESTTDSTSIEVKNSEPTSGDTATLIIQTDV